MLKLPEVKQKEYQRIMRFLFIILIVFMLYQVFITGDFIYRKISFGEMVNRINFAPFYPLGGYVSRMDILSNLLVFFFYGFFFSNALIRKRTFDLALFIMALLSGLFLAGVIEFLELFMESRITAISDIVTAIMGTAVGYICGSISYRYFRTPAIVRVRNIISFRPLLFFLMGYTVLLLLKEAFPFDFSIQVSDIWHKVKISEVVPFANRQNFQNWQLALYTKALSFVVLGFLLHRSFRLYSGLPMVKTISNSILIGMTIILFTEGMQFFVISRYPASGDVVVKIAGILLGILISIMIRPELILCLFYLCILLFYFLSPFEIDFSRIGSKLTIGRLIPFKAYFVKTDIHAFKDMMEMWVLFFPVGFYLCWRGTKGKINGDLSLLCFFIIGLLIGLCFEGLQILIKDRFADITDAINTGVGCLFGAYLCKRGKIFLREQSL